MISAELPKNELERINILKNLEILDTEFEKEYDDLVKLASSICNTPISLVSLIDNNRQWFKAKVGLEVRETGRDIAFCSHAILQDELFVVPNALEDERFCDNPLVIGEPNIRFYAGMPIKTKTGHKMGTLCIIDRVPRELTEHQKFALETLGNQLVNMLELRMQNKRLRQLNDVQNKFISIISHDVKSPLSSLLTLVDMVSDDSLDKEDFKEISSHVNENINYTISLLDNLVNWSFSQILGGLNNMKEISIDELVDEIIKHLNYEAEKKGIELYSEINKGTKVYADQNMLTFIVRNLISNAIKFTAKGSIRVGINENEKGWNLVFIDTGVGIPQSKLEKLFDWDKRYTTKGTSDEKGSGLGLLLCQEFAEKHFGKINIESKEHHGSTFTVELNTKFVKE